MCCSSCPLMDSFILGTSQTVISTHALPLSICFSRSEQLSGYNAGGLSKSQIAGYNIGGEKADVGELLR